MVGYGIIDQQSGKVPAPRAFNPVYAVFIVVAVSVYYWTAVSEKAGLSALLTLSAIWQLSAFSLLVVGVQLSGSAKGISAKSLQLQALALVCRLSSTTWLSGYVPFDRTGDFLYEGFDVLSLLIVLWLLWRLVKDRLYAECDDFPVTRAMIGCLVLAGLLHANLDQRPVFDTLWMFGIFVGALAMLPQLWLTINNSVHVTTGMSHFVAAMVVSCALRGTFFWYAFEDFTSKSLFTMLIKFNLSGYAALTAHLVQLLLLGAFGYSQVKKLAVQALRPPQGPFLQHEV